MYKSSGKRKILHSFESPYSCHYFNGFMLDFSNEENKNIVLGAEQVEALERMKAFLEDKSEKVFSLIGAAGTGKSFLMRKLIDHMDYKGISKCLCAPTHKAKLVLERFANHEAITLHKLLSLSPNLEILELDFKDLKFRVDDRRLQIPKNGVIVCDESSMISDDLFDLLMEKAGMFNCKVIFVGDKCQLRPVNSLTTSKVFDVENKYTLTKIYRQSENNALMPLLCTLRTDTVNWFESKEAEEGSLYVHDDTLKFVKDAIPSFRNAMRNGDILATKILAYTNAMVASYNNCMRRVMWQDSKEVEYNQFEFLTGYENLEFNGIKFWNSMDYIIIDPPEKKEVYIPGFLTLPGYELTLYDSVYKDSCPIFILAREIGEDYLQALASRIETIRLEAINLKDCGRPQMASKRWREYYELIGSFTSPKDMYYDNRLIRKKSFDYGYACSAHKSQGSSFGEVFVDMRNINLCRDKDERRQLQYVALSRTRKDAYLLQ